MARKTKKQQQSDKLIENMEKMRLWDDYLPAVEKFVKEGGTVEEFLRRTTPVAFARLSSLMMDPDPSIAFKASTEVLNRAIGKSVERKQVLYQDVDTLNEKQLDQEIARALKKNPKLLEEARTEQKTIEAQAPQKPKQKQRRKPRVIDLDEDE